MIRRYLACLLFLVGNLSAQSGAADALDAKILAGDLAAARALIAASAGSLGATDRALYEAAVLPAPERALAMLAVARLYPRRAVADRALAAAGGAILLGTARDDELPGLRSREPDAREAWAAHGGLAAATREFAALVRARAAVAGARDNRAWRDARWMDRLARLRRVLYTPVRVRAGQAVPVPAPLADDLDLCIFRWPHRRDASAFPQAALDEEPVRRHRLPRDRYGDHLPPLPPGEYLFELESRTDGGIVLQLVLVSDLDLLAQRVDGAVVALVERDGHPVGNAEVQAGERRARTDAQGIAVLGAAARSRLRVVAVQGAHRASLVLSPVSPGRPATTPTCHAMVDRPVYRHGEVVHGRLVLRAPSLVGLPALAGLTAPGVQLHPAADLPLTLIAWPGSSTPVRVAGRSDRDGVLPFQLSVPADCKPGTVTLQVFAGAPGKRGRQPLASFRLFQVAAYRRAAVLARLTGPTRAAAGTAPTILRLAARLASGAPAAGLAVEVGTDQDAGRRQRAWLDDRGELAIPVAMQSAAGPVRVTAEVQSPDGVVVQLEHRIDPLRSDGPGSAAPAPPIRVVGEAVAGGALQLRLRGEPHRSLLVVVARGLPIGVARVVLDAAGSGAATFELPALAWPSVDVFTASHGATDQLRLPTRPAAGLARVVLATDRVAYGPGDEVRCTVQTTAGSGAPLPARVTVAVVDERIFAIRADRTPALRSSLAPRVPAAYWRSEVATGLRSSHPLHALARMLRGGRLLAPLFSSPGPAGGAPAMAAVPEPAPARIDFRPTVLFRSDLATDAQGRAAVRFRLPDNLTTYRITALAVDRGAGAARAVHRIDTRQPLAVTPLLPRVLRVGDRVHLPVVVDRRATVHGPAAVQLIDQGGAVEIATPEQTSALPAAAAETAFAVVARRAGTARLHATVRVGELADAHQEERPVRADRILVPVTETLRFTGARDWQPQTVGQSRQLTILGSRAALLAVSNRFLADYPHGCVEQTLSRILPFFAVRRAGGRPEVLRPDERRRLQAGLRRLRELRVAADRGFAWWPGGAPDDGMTALVLHGLVMAREGGLDLAAHGLQLTLGAGHVVRQADALVAAGGRVRGADQAVGVPVETAELVAAALRFDPATGRRLKPAVGALLAARQDLPAGLLARCGLALLAADDRAAADAVLGRLRGRRGVQPATDAWSRFPGEDPAAVAATTLELILALAAPGAEQAVIDLYGEFTAGRFGSTYGTACAVAALWKEAGGVARGGGEQVLQVRCGAAAPVRVALTAANGFRQQLTVGAGPLRLAGPAGLECIALATTAVAAPASSHPGWQRGLRVTRRLCRRSGGTVAIPRRGQPLDVVVELQAARRVRYVVVQVPLPAGFEVVDPPAGLEVSDERVVTTVAALAAGQPRRLRFTVLPALTGAVSWPPVTASAMYAPGCTGATPGSRLQVLPPAPAEARTVLQPLPGRPPATATPPAPVLSESQRRDARLRRWADEMHARTLVAGMVHARSAELADADRRLLDELESIFADLPLDEELQRLAHWDPWPWYIERGAAPGPLMAAIADRRLARCRRLVVSAAPNIRRRIQRQAGEVTAILDFLGLARAIGSAGHEPFRSATRAVLATGRGDWIEALLDAHGESFASFDLTGELVALLGHAQAGVRRTALALLPAGRWRQLPTAVLERALGTEWDEDDLRGFLSHPLGGERLLVLARQESFCRSLDDDLFAALPPALVRRLPLVALRHCAGLPELTGAAIPSEDLEAELLQTADAGWQQRLLLALAARGRSHLQCPATADRHVVFDQILRARSGDRDAAMALRRRLWDDAAGRGALELEPGFVAAAFATDWTPREFLSFAADADEQRPGWLRGYPAEWHARLVAALDDDSWWFPLIELPPTAASPRLREALWDLAVRDGDWIGEVAEVLAREPAGAAWLRGKLAAMGDTEPATGLRAALGELVERRDSEPPGDPVVRHRFGLPR